MRVGVFGAGAIGGHVAVRLAAAGQEVSVVARGAHLEAIRARGLTLKSGEHAVQAAVRASADCADLGPQDVVLVTVKATALAAAAKALGPLLTADTLVVFPQNGMTWWYPEDLPPGRPRPPDLPVFRLAAEFLASMRPAQVAGALVYSANEVAAPGLVVNNSPARNRLDMGPVTAAEIPALETFRAALEQAGIGSPRPRDMREAVWQKLLVNMNSSVIALATGTRSSICREDPELGEIYRRVLAEGLRICAAHGYPLDDRVNADELIANIPRHKPSLLQDYEHGRTMEIGEIVLAPQAFARAAGVATPTLDVLAAVATRLARERGLYPD